MIISLILLIAFTIVYIIVQILKYKTIKKIEKLHSSDYNDEEAKSWILNEFNLFTPKKN